MVLRLSLCPTDIRCASHFAFFKISQFFLSFLLPENQDLKGLEEMSFEFEMGLPFRPFEQLMGVMPEASKELLPLPYRVRSPFYRIS